jgi:hypothetical protein
LPSKARGSSGPDFSLEKTSMQYYSFAIYSVDGYKKLKVKKVILFKPGKIKV